MNGKLRKSSFLLVFLLVFLSLSSFSFGRKEIPPAPQNFYYDELGILTPETKKHINETNFELEDKAGVQVVVTTIADLEGEDPFTYGVELFNAWQIGKTENRGVLIQLAQEPSGGQRNMHINIIVGYDLEGRLNDGKIGRIIDNIMIEDLARGRENPLYFNEGLEKGFDVIVGEIAEEYNIELTGEFATYDETSNAELSGMKLIVGIFIFMMIMSVIQNMNRPGGPGGRSGRRGPVFIPMGGFGGSPRGSRGFGGGGGRTGGGGAGRSF